MDLTGSGSHLPDQVIQAGTVGIDLQFKTQGLPGSQDGYSVFTDRTVHDDLITRLYMLCRADVGFSSVQNSNPRCIDEDLIAFAVINHLCVAGNDLHSRYFCFFSHGSDDLFQFVHLKSLFDDE